MGSIDPSTSEISVEVATIPLADMELNCLACLLILILSGASHQGGRQLVIVVFCQNTLLLGSFQALDA